MEGHRPALSASLKRQLLYKFFWWKLRLNSYNSFWPFFLHKWYPVKVFSAPVSIYIWLSLQIFFRHENDCNYKFESYNSHNHFLIFNCFHSIFQIADKICSAANWPYYIIILYWCLKNFSCSRCVLSTNGTSSALFISRGWKFMSLCSSVLMFERSWWPGETPEDWKKTSITFVFTKDKTKDLGSYKAVSFTLTLRKVMKQISLENICKYMKIRNVNGHSQHRLMKRKAT